MLTDNFLTVKEAVKYLGLNGVEYHEVYFRTMLLSGIIRSKKMFNSRVIPKSELNRIIEEKRK
jgi:hypothetical protein